MPKFINKEGTIVDAHQWYPGKKILGVKEYTKVVYDIGLPPVDHTYKGYDTGKEVKTVAWGMWVISFPKEEKNVIDDYNFHRLFKPLVE